MPSIAFRRTAGTVALGGLALGAFSWYRAQKFEEERSKGTNVSVEEKRKALEWRPPSRASLIQSLQNEEFDLVIIGGGATGTGCALDAASRGLKVALVEKGDFSSGTSSKSTKLVHGGVRYLEKAFLKLDWSQFQMVKEALHERSTFLSIAPHLTSRLPIMLPIYKWYMVPYYWAGSKAYDMVAGSKGIDQSYFLSRSKALRAFPMLRKDDLVGAMVYYDGEQNDARTNVTLALTALFHGATVTNYTKVVDFTKTDDSGKLDGVIIEDLVGNSTFKIRCKGVVNATGPFCDTIRKLDNPKCDALMRPSSGTHIVFPSYYSPERMGLIDPSSSDGRVVFFLPWEGNTIAGTTDTPSPVTFEPKATGNDIDFIFNEVQGYLDPDIQLRKSDILAAWSGLRPLVRDPTKTFTQELVRNHIILVSENGLLTIAGGKWTTYRKMAEETIDAAISQFTLKPKHLKSKTEKLSLIGAHGYDGDNFYIKLIQRFGIETEVAKHLARNYGDRATLVASIAEGTDKRWPLYGRRLVAHYPFLEAEVRYAVRFEYAITAADIIARRTRLAHLSCQAALDALPKIVDLMAEELGWDEMEKKRQVGLGHGYLDTCGLSDLHPVRAEFARQPLEDYKTIFNKASESDKKDFVPISHDNAITSWKMVMKNEVSDSFFIDWKAVLEHVDKAQLGSIGFVEFLDGISYIRSKYIDNDSGTFDASKEESRLSRPERSNWSA